MVQPLLLDDVSRQIVNLRRLGVECGRCDNREHGYVYPKGPHLQLDCVACGRYMKFISRYDAERAGYQQSAP